MVTEDLLGEVKKAIVAVGKLPGEVCGSGAEQYFDGAEADFEVARLRHGLLRPRHRAEETEPRVRPFYLCTVFPECSSRHPEPLAIHSSSFDQRFLPETFLTAMAAAFFWPTSTTSRLPRVMPV